MPSRHPMRLCIIIEGDSAEELFAVGPKDLKNHFLPNDLGVKSSDIKQISFRQVTETDSLGLPTKERVHLDNFYRRSHHAK